MSFLQCSDNFISFPNHQKPFRVASDDFAIHGKSRTRGVDVLAVLTHYYSGVWKMKWIEFEGAIVIRGGYILNIHTANDKTANNKPTDNEGRLHWSINPLRYQFYLLI